MRFTWQTFEELKYQGGSIGDILDDRWIRYLKKEGVASVDLVREFYAALLDVADIDAQVWSVIVSEVTLVSRYPGCIFGATEADWSISYSRDGEQARCGRIFRTLTGQDVVVVGPFVKRKFIPHSGLFCI